MEITGRLTADAAVATTKNDKQFVKFTIAINDYYKPKNGEAKNFVTYIQCAYWLGTGIAKRLIKGACVTVTGRISVNAWLSGNNEARAAINLHVATIKPQSGLAKKQNESIGVEAGAAPVTEPIDDLPF